MKWSYRSRRKRRILWWAGGTLVVILLAVVAAKYWPKSIISTNSTVFPKSSTARPIPQPLTVRGRYLLNGTIFWARDVERYANLAHDLNQPFSQLNTFGRSKYDAWSTDFECPITNHVVPWQTEKDLLIFNCRPEFLPYAAKYFNIYDLANNHTDNQGGEAGILSTRKYLDRVGVQYFGSFDPSVAKDVCEVLALPVKVTKADKSVKSGSLPIAFCGWHYFYRLPRPGEVEVMRRYAKIMPVFAFTEAGTEYRPHSNQAQQDIAHHIMDQGPDFLIANQPHWVQETEVYKGRLIVYSTGNFIFDQLDAETNRSASIGVSLAVKYDTNVGKWLALGPSCFKFQDDCLERAEQEGLTKIKPDIKFGVVAGQGGDAKITHRADAATQKAVEARMNWSQTCKQLVYNSCL